MIMGWRKIVFDLSLSLAMSLLSFGFNYLDIDNDGSLSRSEIKKRASDIRKLLR